MKKKEVKGILYGKVVEFAEKIAPIYKELDWKWHDKDVPPTQAEIETALRELIKHHGGGEGHSSTGGLTVFFDKEDCEIGISFTCYNSTYF